MRSAARSRAGGPSARRLRSWSISPGPTATGGSASRPTDRPTWSSHCSSIRAPIGCRRSSGGSLPVDQRAAQILRECSEHDSRLRLTDDARHALTEVVRAPVARPEPPVQSPVHDVELRRDRRGRNWILIASEHAPLARALARVGALDLLDGPAGSVALAAVQADGVPIAELLAQLEVRSVDPHVEPGSNGPRPGGGRSRSTARTRRRCSCCSATTSVCRARCGSARWRAEAARACRSRWSPGGRSTPNRSKAGSAMPRNGAWPRSRRGGRRRRRCSSCPRSTTSPRSCSHPGTISGWSRSSRAHSAPRRTPAAGGGRAGDPHDRLPAIVADPFWVPDLDRFIAEHEPWVAPDALDRPAADPGGARALRRAGGTVRRDRRRIG